MTNELALRADGSCAGEVTIQYTLRSADHPRGFDWAPNADCSIDPSHFQPSNPILITPAGGLRVRASSPGYIWPELIVESTLVYGALCPGQAATGTFQGESSFYRPRFTPFPEEWTTQCGRGHRQVWDYWSAGEYPTEEVFILEAGGTNQATVICKARTLLSGVVHEQTPECEVFDMTFSVDAWQHVANLPTVLPGEVLITEIEI